MERLTKRIDEHHMCIEVCEEACIEGNTFCPKCKPFTAVLEKLMEYEDLEEQGLLLKLPCKVGDTVYELDWYFDCELEECKWVEPECEECDCEIKKHFIKETNFQIQMIAIIGKTVFLTKAEAEKALEEMRCE